MYSHKMTIERNPPILIVLLVQFLFFSLYLNFYNVTGLKSENIVGGIQSTSDRQFPWVVAINGDLPFSCGGALISTSLVLTAAHCVHDNENEHIMKMQYSIVAGTKDLNNGKGKKIYVSDVYTHKDYKYLSNKTILHDIAILRLKESLEVRGDSQFNIIGLPDDDKESYEGKIGVVAGFGYDKIETFFDPEINGFRERGSSNNYLNYVYVQTLSNDQCNISMPSLLCGKALQSPDEDLRGVCSGDSGNILAVDGKAVGVLNTSPPGCSERKKSAKYARVTYYLPFIRGVMSGQLTAETVKTTITYYPVKAKPKS